MQKQQCCFFYHQSKAFSLSNKCSDVCNNFCNFVPMNRISESNPTQCDTIATIGVFDGVHLGHTFLLDELKAQAQKSGLQTLVISFFASPLQTLNPALEIHSISTAEEKMARFEQLQLQNCLMLDFDAALAQKTAYEFLCFLKTRFRVKKLLMGYDHRFGSDKISDLAEYKKIGEKAGVEVINCTSFLLNENRVSSSAIRSLILDGEIEAANHLLGYPYSLSGEITHGNKIGRTIGFPTANLSVSPQKLLPKNGVYVVDVLLDSNRFKGLLNIGTRPTLNGEDKSIEVHIIDFDEDIYKKTVVLKIKKRLRDEQKFDSLAQLKAQIAKDKTTIE